MLTTGKVAKAGTDAPATGSAGAVSGLSVSLTSTAAGASQVNYTVKFTASATGALAANQGTFTLAAPAGTTFAGGLNIDDLTTGNAGILYDFQGTITGSTLTIATSVPIAPGDKVKLTYTQITNATTTGPQQLAFSTSSDTTPVTAGVTLTPGNQPVASLGGISLSSTAAAASQVSYTLTFTASPTGGLAANFGTFTLTAPAGTTFAGGLHIDDLTTGATGALYDFQGTITGSTLTIATSVPIAPGDKVKLTYTQITNVTTTGPQQLSFSTSSDIKPVTARFRLTPASRVAAPDVSVSTQAPGHAATYTVTFTTSATGALIHDNGQITLAAPAGTSFGSGVSYQLDDITSGQSTGLSGSTSANGATVTFGLPITVGAGDQVKITATGVTNPTATGHVAMLISTTSDTVAAATPRYIIGDSIPLFTAATPPLVVAPGSRQQYKFTTSGYPAAAYSLSGGPSWLSINSATGRLSGTVPRAARSFTYSVSAVNRVGRSAEGPYTVTIGASASVSGKVVDSSGNPVADVTVDGCDTTGGSCESATTSDTGAFSLAAVAGSSIVLTAYPPQGSGQATTSTGVIKVPSRGITGETITTQDGIPPVTGGLKINGTTSPTVYWASPATATITGCPYGMAVATVIGQNTQTGAFDSSVIDLAESPAGSGFYKGVIPPQEPVHGPVEIEGSVTCPQRGPLFPSLGPANGGTTVLITGAGFSGVTGVSFGGVPAASYTVLSQADISAVAPAGKGTVPVTVQEGRSADVAGRYTYQAITSVKPASGPARGGTWVIIKGTGLGSATNVMFGTTGVKFYQLSGTEIEALSPGGTGTTHITVTTAPGGTTPATAADRFRYTGSGAPATLPAVASPAVASPAVASPAVASPAVASPAVASAAVASASTHDPAIAKELSRLLSSTGAAGGSGGGAAPGAAGVTGAARAADAARIARALSAGKITSKSPILLALVLAAIAGADRVVFTRLMTLYRVFRIIIDSLHPTCHDSEQQVAYSAFLLAMPWIQGFTKKAINLVKNGAWPLIKAQLAGTSLLEAAVMAEGLIPLLVTGLVAFLAQKAINTLVKAVLGSCPPDSKNQGPVPPVPPSSSQPDYFSPDALIDPSGTVLDTNRHPVKGATVTILRSYTRHGAYLPVSASAPGIFPAVNPEVTGSNGAFHWDVSAGYYKVAASAPGCTVPGSTKTTAVIGPYPVPPPRVGLTITLKCKSEKPPARPAVTSLSVASGPPSGGTAVTVLGANFTPGSSVEFGAARAKSVRYLSPQALKVVAPKGHGLVDLRVRTAGGTSAKKGADKFFFGTAPAVAKVAPARGPASGGTRVTIRGKNFTGVTAVTFGGLPARKFRVRSATRIVAVSPLAVPGAAAVQVANRAGASATSHAATFTYLARPVVYVATAAGLAVATTSGKVVTVVKVPGATHVAATPDGGTVLVTSARGVTPVDATTREPGRTVRAGKGAGAIAVMPDGKTAYVVNPGSRTVTRITVATGQPGRRTRVGAGPDAIAITPNGKTAYVANYRSGTITPVTTRNGKARKPIRVGKGPDAIAIAPNGKTAYVANYRSGTITPVRIAVGKAGRPIRTGGHPRALAISPDGKTLYVVKSGSDKLTVIATGNDRARRPIRAGRDPVAIALAPDGKTAYVTGYATGKLTVIKIAAGKPVRTVKVGKRPRAVTAAA